MAKKGNSARYIIFILLQSILYGIGNPLSKVAFESITPMWFLATRFVLSFLICLVLFGRETLKTVKIVRPTVWLPAAVCTAFAYITCNIALDLTSATNVGFIMSLPVLFAPALSTIIIKEKYNIKRLPLQILMVAGLYLLCCNGGTFSFGSGEIIALIEAFFIAGFLVFSESALKKVSGTTLLTLQLGVSMVISVIGAFLFDDVSVLSCVTPAAWGIVVYMAIGCTVIAFFLQNLAVAHLSASTVAILQCTQPILTAAVAFLMLGEVLSDIGLAGAVLIIICLIIDNRLQACS